jgi:glutamate racemase
MIAMFDSGLGGLSVWRAFSRALPDWSVTYLADQAYCPYGPRTQAEITQRSLRIAHWLHQRGATLLVVACNTATSAAVEAIRRELPIPVVGVEPAVKPAAAASRTGRIAVLATQSMLKSARFRSLLQRHAGEVEVLSRPGRGWVECVEAGDLDSPHARKVVTDVVQPLLHENIDHIVLGCTHYPFLAPLIREVAGDGITLDDPAEAIARRAAELIGTQTPQQHFGYRFYTTSADTTGMATVLPRLIGQPFTVERALARD